ncbi:LacI family DNA-binding transcriptional regulator [Brachybacterium sp. J144]|uniref:LacI family DNA-binding transcriptional regulator n=1 Tax=Brachybacterium sp. J144 TaxID=3116487 RepID=UPI002E78386A|nr:LacI family DNA-binding transcriptional regulator [Brachybacterium sp. J144]MEE1651034.1 LacI family DNA-binding transcriptional regulator [Brachybacterium sp. J144]
MSTPSSPSPRGSGRGKRVTIADIAARAGVTSAAVSLAVNGRPGVSDATRARILEIARELHWEPSPSARALAGAPVLSIGMVLARPAEVLGNEAFFGAFSAGLQDVLSAQDYSLQMKIVQSVEAEIDTYRRWFAQRRVDGIVMVDLQLDDPRIPALEELGRPALVIGGPGHHGTLPSVYVDDALATRLIVEHLAGLGHQRIARVAGTRGYHHTAQRDDAFLAVCAERGVTGTLHEAGFGAVGAARTVTELIASDAPPTAIVLDSDEMARAGAHVLQESGIAIPDQVAIASYEDSPLARMHRPPLTAIGRSAVEYGRRAAHRLLELIEEDRVSRRGGGAAGAGLASGAEGDAPAGAAGGPDGPEGAPAHPELRAIAPELLIRASTDPDAATDPLLLALDEASAAAPSETTVDRG